MIFSTVKLKQVLFTLPMISLTYLASPTSAIANEARKPILNEINLQELGQKIFSDPKLSKPEGQSCMSCHNPAAAFSDPSKALPVSRGADHFSFGGRNAPTAMYMKFAKPLSLETEDGKQLYEGGLFWDGRANTLEDQAKGPFLNPLEMGETKLGVVTKVCSSTDYGPQFRSLFGKAACDFSNAADVNTKVEQTYDMVAKAIASFERTDVFSPFSSKFDKVMAGKDSFTESELRGFELFKDPKAANCAACHTIDDKDSKVSLFTDFTYDNLGLPASEEMSYFGHGGPDLGLTVVTKRPEDTGKFKVPTLRNISVTSPYMHNGYLRNLEQVLDFYNTRDTKAVCSKNLTAEEATLANCWPAAETPQTMNREELGRLNLSQKDIRDLIAFLNTLTDGYWTK